MQITFEVNDRFDAEHAIRCIEAVKDSFAYGPKPKPEPKPEPKAKPASKKKAEPEKKTADGGPTQDQVREALMAVCNTQSPDSAFKILNTFGGARSIGDVPKEQWGDLLSKLNEAAEA